ncbi:putative restriction endonuclease [Aquiflexum balticum DSM 16537]|uniref:Putative restriction endonuclease n=1 Tax=Aquiflexum balticum DSM 16537 TaxID=758820 RepID=A0A1W2H0L2_9BACT|nr:HNH endonuclease [Aquiflexum balticum]SMD42460.1 putative restriction endonuclease [Aquiflexum balticum DSM 16537]
MKVGQKLWKREELILAINLYWKLEFGKIHQGNPEVIKLAKLLGRTPSSIVFKLGNFGSFDPSLQERGVGGLKNTSKLDEKIWNEFYGNIEETSFESEKLRAKFEHVTVEVLNDIDEADLPKEGLVREQIVKTRVNQNFFRKAILASYKNTCCITGINHPSLLVAGHIIPWSVDEKNRMNPRNGLCLNPLHDRAYELGLITIDTNYQILVSTKVPELQGTDVANLYFEKYHKQKILLPGRYLPDKEFLDYHFTTRFQK